MCFKAQQRDIHYISELCKDIQSVTVGSGMLFASAVKQILYVSLWQLSTIFKRKKNITTSICD